MRFTLIKNISQNIEFFKKELYNYERKLFKTFNE